MCLKWHFLFQPTQRYPKEVCKRNVVVVVYRGQETEEKFVTEGGATWAEQTDAEERAAATERQVYSIILLIKTQ